MSNAGQTDGITDIEILLKAQAEALKTGRVQGALGGAGLGFGLSAIIALIKGAYDYAQSKKNGGSDFE